MRYATLTIILAVLLSGAVLAAGPAAAGASGGACSVREARSGLRVAHRAHLRAAARESEARRILGATCAYGRSYGVPTARWVRLARRVGWPWGQMPTLMLVVDRESGGNPCAQNPTSTASGLMQFLSSWWSGRWNPFDPRVNLAHGYRAWREVGWQPWAL